MAQREARQFISYGRAHYFRIAGRCPKPSKSRDSSRHADFSVLTASSMSDSAGHQLAE